MRVHSFPAVVGPNARVLILGSMPGVASLQASQYYAHPRNQFWRILGHVLEFDAQSDYRKRLNSLRRHRIAVWDVLHSCIRPGSLDSAIQHHCAIANNLAGLLRQTPSIRRICCNGATAHTSLQRHFGRQLLDEFPSVEVLRLPSTSPANASWSYARKLTAWSRAIQLVVD